MNKERLYDLIKNIKDVVALLDKALMKLKEIEDEDINLLIQSAVKQSFLEYFILIENYSSMCLKEIKAYKISDDMETALTKLYNNNIIDSEILSFLNEYRRYRNRIAHVYKQPTIEEIIEFIEINKGKMYTIIKQMNEMYKKI